MADSKVNVTSKAVATVFAAMMMLSVSLQAHAFIFLVPVIAGKDDKAMKSSDIMNKLIENTVVVQRTDGTAYGMLHADGGAVGLDPEQGKIDGSWKVNSDGETCVTWNYPSGVNTRCAKLFNLGEGNYQWGERQFTVKPGDVKNLGN